MVHFVPACLWRIPQWGLPDIWPLTSSYPPGMQSYLFVLLLLLLLLLLRSVVAANTSLVVAGAWRAVEVPSNSETPSVTKPRNCSDMCAKLRWMSNHSTFCSKYRMGYCHYIILK